VLALLPACKAIKGNAIKQNDDVNNNNNEGNQSAKKCSIM
jgi:hypothetical protein